MFRKNYQIDKIDSISKCRHKRPKQVQAMNNFKIILFWIDRNIQQEVPEQKITNLQFNRNIQVKKLSQTIKVIPKIWHCWLCPKTICKWKKMF